MYAVASLEKYFSAHVYFVTLGYTLKFDSSQGNCGKQTVQVPTDPVATKQSATDGSRNCGPFNQNSEFLTPSLGFCSATDSTND